MPERSRPLNGILALARIEIAMLDLFILIGSLEFLDWWTMSKRDLISWLWCARDIEEAISVIFGESLV